MNAFAVNMNSGSKKPAVFAWIIDALETDRIVRLFAAVASILGMRSGPQVFAAVIKAVMVFVIDFLA